eukprot:RCo049972
MKKPQGPVSNATLLGTITLLAIFTCFFVALTAVLLTWQLYRSNELSDLGDRVLLSSLIIDRLSSEFTNLTRGILLENALLLRESVENFTLPMILKAKSETLVTIADLVADTGDSLWELAVQRDTVAMETMLSMVSRVSSLGSSTSPTLAAVLLPWLQRGQFAVVGVLGTNVVYLLNMTTMTVDYNHPVRCLSSQLDVSTWAGSVNASMLCLCLNSTGQGRAQVVGSGTSGPQLVGYTTALTTDHQTVGLALVNSLADTANGVLDQLCHLANDTTAESNTSLLVVVRPDFVPYLTSSDRLRERARGDADSFVRRAGVRITASYAVSAILSFLTASFISAVNVANNLVMSQSDEIVLGSYVNTSNGTQLVFLSDLKFRGMCPDGHCGASLMSALPMREALAHHTGTTVGDDYASQPSVGAFTYVDSIDIGLVVKRHKSMIDAMCTWTSTSIFDTLNEETPGSAEFMLAEEGAPVGFLTQPKFPSGCLNNPTGCSGDTALSRVMLSAIRGHNGTTRIDDYRGVPVYAGYASINDLDLGLLLKIDSSEEEQPLVISTIILAFTSTGIAAIGVAILFACLRFMVHGILAAKHQLEERTIHFQQVVSQLYPTDVAARLAQGITMIAEPVPRLTFCFADICSFTQIQRTYDAERLVEFLTHVFGVMDAIASFYEVYRVKTVGDCYFCVTGLTPSKAQLDQVMQMLYFTSACLQVFSDRFCHGPKG